MLPSLGTDRLPLADFAALDWRVTALSLTAAALVALALTLPTLILNSASGPTAGLHSESRGATAGRATQRLRHVFAVAQVGLAFVLLSSAGLLGLSLNRVLETSPGFRTSEILAGNITLPYKGYQDGPSHLAFVERLLPAIRSLPGVEQASVATALPFNGNSGNSAGAIEGITDRAGEMVRAYNFSCVSADYWRTMGIRLVKGRLLEDGDNHRMPHVCVVDQAFADSYWPGGDPLGHRITPFNVKFDKDNCLTIVGVVSNVKQNDLTEASGNGSIYMPFCIQNSGFFSIVVRSSLPDSVMAPLLRKAVKQLDPGLPVDNLEPMRKRIDDSLVARRSPAILAGIFSAVALLLAAVGTYGVLSYAVGQRRREIGVRMALGALPIQVRNQFLAIGVRLLGFGITAGLLGAWLAGRAMQSVLYGVPVVSAGILAATAAILAAITLGACILPAGRAATVDPIEALRLE
jgi:predicted permease